MDERKTETVVGDREPVNRRSVAFAIAFVIVAVLWGVLRQQFALVLLYPLLLTGTYLARLRPATVISADGIRRPWRPRSVIGWDDVRSVMAPQPGVPSARVMLVSGKTVSLAGVPAARSANVAGIGDKPVEPPPRPAMPPAPPRRRTDEDVSADVERRAAALSAEWRRMEKQSPRRQSGE